MIKNIEDKLSHLYEGFRKGVYNLTLVGLGFVAGCNNYSNSERNSTSESYEVSENSLEKKSEENVTAYIPNRNSKINDLEIEDDTKEEKSEGSPFLRKLVRGYFGARAESYNDEMRKNIGDINIVDDLRNENYSGKKEDKKLENIDEAPKATEKN